LKSKFINKNFIYDGSQLRALYAYREFGILGDSIISWVGPCNVSPEHMVDGEDLNMGEKICGDEMLHFIVEKFNINLFSAVALQRIMTSLAIDVIKKQSKKASLLKKMIRDGDDIYVADKKLSISIATVSPSSALIHFAINVKNTGTPIKTISFSELRIDVMKFVKEFFPLFVEEVETIELATQKVHWVE
jgi:hypothetical protein